jgi:hypothetical protein
MTYTPGSSGTLLQSAFAPSLDHCEAALALYDPGRQDLLLPTEASSNDRDVPPLAYSGLNISVLGWPDRALARAREATALARRIDQAASLVFALAYEVFVHMLRRDTSAQRERAAELVEAVDTGLALAGETGQAIMDTELHRLQGEITLRAVDSRGSRVESRESRVNRPRRSRSIGPSRSRVSRRRSPWSLPSRRGA